MDMEPAALLLSNMDVQLRGVSAPQLYFIADGVHTLISQIVADHVLSCVEPLACEPPVWPCRICFPELAIEAAWMPG